MQGRRTSTTSAHVSSISSHPVDRSAEGNAHLVERTVAALPSDRGKSKTYCPTPFLPGAQAAGSRPGLCPGAAP